MFQDQRKNNGLVLNILIQYFAKNVCNIWFERIEIIEMVYSNSFQRLGYLGMYL